MESVLISDLIPTLQQPGLMPGMEEECQQLLQLFRDILPVLPVVVSRLLKSSVYSREVRECEAWLRDVNAAAYEVDDIVDEFRYEKLQAEAETNRHQSGDKARTGIFSLCKLISGMRERLPIKGGMRERLPIKEGTKERLTELVTRVRDLLETSTCDQGLMPVAESREGPILSSLKEIDPIIVGRDEDKEQIVNRLLDSNAIGDTNTIVVIPIYGFEGEGKTTLARYTCADARIKDNFEVILWVDVGEEFDVPRIAKSVIDQVIGKDCCLSEGDPDLLQRRIYQELSGKRFLLVLDDVGGELTWEQLKLKWEQLKSWLEQSAAIGSSLIVTTLWEGVASIMSSTGGYKMHISSLREDDLWTLFCNRAFFADRNISPEILEISRQILKKCKDSQDVNLMAGLMRFKKELAEWQQVNHQLNQSFVAALCITHLSPETREWFAFCSVFPKGHYMDKEVLVKLWMANGLISSDRSTTVEEKGNHIFNELALRNLLEDVKLVPESLSRDKHGYHSRVIYRLHPGIHDLASYLLQYKYEFDFVPRPNRFQFIPGDSPVDIPELLENNPDLRNLIFSNDPFIRNVKCSVLPNSNSFRALHLPSALFDRDMFELKYTKHLRYLDLSGSRIKRLPESTSSLYFMQTLNLSKCLLLERLPEDMRYMRSLTHLHVDKCLKLKEMPLHLGQLSGLKILTTYIVGGSAGNGIDELKCLNLSGLLEIYNLRMVKDATIAKEVDLFSKINLERLTLCWGRQQLVMSKGNNHSEVLEALQPHNGLKVLKIQQYGGNEFANWLTNPVDLLNLVELHLIGCSQCSTIPPVWKMPSLRVLCLKYMINLTCMYNFESTSFPGIDKKDDSELFPSLKRLVLVGLKRLERWHGEEGMQRTIPSFPVLDEMEITSCPELKSMPSVPMLKYLTISIENHGLLQSTIDLITQSQSLVEVSIAKASYSDNEALSELGAEVKGRNSQKLRVMRLDSTNSFFMARAFLIPHLRLGFWRSLVSLENLDIFNCSSIFAWPLEEFRNLHKLKRLSFRKCPNLTGLNPNQLQKDETVLPLLQYLEFYACPFLKEIPRCTSILFLELDECPKINSISGFNNLKMAYLSCLDWTSLPTGFQDLKKLESLRVSECYCLECLPVELAGLTSLRTLIIDKCARVHRLPDGLDQMLSGLEKFQISECPALEKFCEEGPYSSIISQIGQSTEASSSSEGSE